MLIYHHLVIALPYIARASYYSKQTIKKSCDTRMKCSSTTT
ncbi:hypothetical protein OIU79_015389 [Salix purpurea]|uniref:Uncharacterized protein n=1 Tax=Salix purpurea TaxID=77065 RepID=A0A9Q0PBS3_SALPP|nr:hypothetical protein OIU79_015389 [Salix purpurea]